MCDKFIYIKQERNHEGEKTQHRTLSPICIFCLISYDADMDDTGIFSIS